jgi:5-deoxy-glucuronate isomerase
MTQTQGKGESVFGRIENPVQGFNPLSTIGGLNADMLMDNGYLLLAAGETHAFGSGTKETAILLLSGDVEYVWQGNSVLASRADSFKAGPWCLHIPCGAHAVVTALKNAELFVSAAENEAAFASVLYTPENTACTEAGRDDLQGTARRDIRTVFDYASAPHSNLVMGEVVGYPGRWSSYPPHHHAQPELYFFRFDKPQGFGACFIGDEAFMTRHLSCAAIPGGLAHPQAAAPGYMLHYVWVIRHLPGNPWKAERRILPEHEWLTRL